MATVLGCNKAVQGEALPTQRLLELVLGRPVRLVVMEDNESSIAIVKKGWSPKLRTLLRNQKCNLQQLHEIISADPDSLGDRGPVELRHHPGETHKGDLFIKFLVPCKFESGLELLGMRKARLPPPSKKERSWTSARRLPAVPQPRVRQTMLHLLTCIPCRPLRRHALRASWGLSVSPPALLWCRAAGASEQPNGGAGAVFMRLVT